MHTLFLGNLPHSATEAHLRDLFRKTSVEIISMELRRGGIGFVHCPDQNAADRAIEVLNGFLMFGMPIRVEPSMPRQHRSTKVFVRQMPGDVEWEEFDTMIAEFGEVVNCDRAGSDESPTAIITYKTFEQAEGAAEHLNKREFQGQILKASIYHERSRNMRRNTGGNAGGGGGIGGGGGRMNRSGSSGGGIPDRYSQRPNNNASDMPLRMVVNARYVGAIIGQGGANIRQITKDSKARCVVDVNRGIRDPTGNVEKVINIFGTLENASRACTKILEVIQREAVKEPANQGKTVEPELKLRAHNNLVGRLIGKAGSTIKKIMEETGCTIFVSNISELNAFNMERTITIRGALENIAQAEQKISVKLRQCWETDLANAPSAMYGGMHPLMQVPPLGGPVGDPYGYPPNVQHGFIPGGGPPHPGVGRPGAMATTPIHGTPGSAPMMPPGGPMAGGVGPNSGFIETVHLWVPNHIVGALIGTKGANIRNVIRLTGAHIRIESTKGENEPEPTSPQPAGGQQQQGQQQQQQRRDSDGERRVTVTGNDQQQYKAQFWIYQRICEHGYHFFDEVRLCTEVQVPSKVVGRIIGKGGQNVRELQRVTGAQVKIPEDAANEEVENTFVQIIGNFNASQAVQARVRQLVQQFHNNQQSGGRSTSADRQPRRNRQQQNHYSEDRD